MPYYYYGFDWTYLVLVLPCMLLSLWASSNVNSTFKRYAKQFSSRRITGADAARRVLAANGVHGVRIDRVSGNLTDHYDPRANVIRLSDSVFDSTSTAAIGVACHEAGHAVQYAVHYAPMKIRAMIIPITNIGSKLAMPLILLGILALALQNCGHKFWIRCKYALSCGINGAGLLLFVMSRQPYAAALLLIYLTVKSFLLAKRR